MKMKNILLFLITTTLLTGCNSKKASDTLNISGVEAEECSEIILLCKELDKEYPYTEYVVQEGDTVEKLYEACENYYGGLVTLLASYNGITNARSIIHEPYIEIILPPFAVLEEYGRNLDNAPNLILLNEF